MQEKYRQDPEHHVLVINDGKRRAIALDAAAYSIGRDPSNAIVLDMPTISRQHAILLRLPIPNTNRYRYRLIDGNSAGKPSANGVFVNGERCTTHELKKGDTIRFGRKVQASYLTVAMGDAEFVKYLESTTFHSLKSEVVNHKETIVAAEMMGGPPTAVAERDPAAMVMLDTKITHPGDTIPEVNVGDIRHHGRRRTDQVAAGAKSTHFPRLWMAMVPVVMIVTALCAWWFTAGSSNGQVESPAPATEQVR